MVACLLASVGHREKVSGGFAGDIIACLLLALLWKGMMWCSGDFLGLSKSKFSLSKVDREFCLLEKNFVDLGNRSVALREQRVTFSKDFIL